MFCKQCICFSNTGMLEHKPSYDNREEHTTYIIWVLGYPRKNGDVCGLIFYLPAATRPPMYKFRNELLCTIPGTVAPPRPSTPILFWFEVCAGSMIDFQSNSESLNLSPALNEKRIFNSLTLMTPGNAALQQQQQHYWIHKINPERPKIYLLRFLDGSTDFYYYILNFSTRLPSAIALWGD